MARFCSRALAAAPGSGGIGLPLSCRRQGSASHLPPAQRGARTGYGLLALGVLLLAAQHPRRAAAESHAVGARYLDRPLVLPEGVIRIDGGPKRPFFGGQVVPGGQLQLFLNESSDFVQLVAGGAYGIGDGWELGAVWPLQLSPDFDLRDLSIYGSRSIAQDAQLSVAAFGEVRVPVESDFELAGGAPVQYRYRPDVRIDTGAYLRLALGDDARVALQLPVSVPVRIAPDWTLGPELGVEVVDFDSLNLPLGVLGTYSMGRGLRSLGDLFARIALVDLLDGLDAIRLDVGVDLYFDR